MSQGAQKLEYPSYDVFVGKKTLAQEQKETCSDAIKKAKELGDDWGV